MIKSLEKFFLKAKKISCKKGQIILYPNGIPAGLFFIETGYVKDYIVTRSGEEKIHCFYKPGNIFPLQCISYNISIQNYYEAITNVDLHIISREELRNYLNTNNDGMNGMLEEVGQCLNMYERRLNNLQYTSSHDRLISRLIFMAERFGINHDTDIIINVPITHKDIASSINTSRETVNKEFKLLASLGIISYKRGQIIIHNIKNLINQFPDSAQ